VSTASGGGDSPRQRALPDRPPTLDHGRTATSPSLWARGPRHRPPRTTPTVGQWEPASLAHLTADRRQLAAALHDGARPAGADEGAVERLLLAYEELASNALRHGRGPVQIAVTTTGAFWLLEVSDASTDTPPSPAVGRDPAQGGLDLHLVARISEVHGWAIDGERKVVWARIDYLDPRARENLPTWKPPPGATAAAASDRRPTPTVFGI
jgi:hypothetical protein